MGLNGLRSSKILAKNNRTTIVGIIAVILVTSILILFAFSIFSGSKATKLTIYTYESLINWGLDPKAANTIVFDTFEDMHGIEIELRYFSEATDLLTVAIQEKNDPQADIIIGLDNILVFEAKKQNLFQQYNSSMLTHINPELINALDPEHYLLPYDYGSIALYYNAEHFNETYGLDKSYFDQIKLVDLLDPMIARELILIDPTSSSTGLSFFLWTIGVCEYTPEGQKPDKNWQQWWEEIDEYLQIEASWTDAFNAIYSGTTNRHMVISYATDGAYNMLFYNSTDLTACLTHENGQTGDNGYAWLQVEGLGIVKGTKQLELAKKFVDWFLGPTAQAVLPLNQWMYPANSEVVLPPEYDYAVNISKVESLNALVPTADIENNLESWLDTWELIVIGG